MREAHDYPGDETAGGFYLYISRLCSVRGSTNVMTDDDNRHHHLLQFARHQSFPSQEAQWCSSRVL